MPLSLDDLDSYFEFSLSDSLEKDKIGSIVGDGTPIGDYGPYATEIEFNVYKDKLQKFMVLMGEYAFPIGSYFEIDGQGHYKLFEDNLSGIRLEFKNLDDEGIEKLYSDISNLNDKYQYETLIRYGGRVFVYYYSSDIDLFKSSLNKYIEDNGLKRKIEIYSMPEVFKDIGEK